jgi:hypothetical protein
MRAWLLSATTTHVFSMLASLSVVFQYSPGKGAAPRGMEVTKKVSMWHLRQGRAKMADSAYLAL